MFGIFRRLFRRQDEAVENVVGGADDVFHAILERADGGKRYVVTLGEPELVDRGGEFTTDFMVRIPTFTVPGEPEPPNVEYDLPDAGMDDGECELFDLLALYGIEQIADLADLEGETVMATFEGGVLSLRFDQIPQEE